MKLINAVTDFGIKQVKPIGAKREIKGELWVVAEVPCRYMNNDDPMFLRRVIHYETGCNLPVRSPNKHNASAKDYLSAAETFLDTIPIAEVKKETSKWDKINS